MVRTNPAAADMLEDSVRKYFKDRRLFFIMGVFKDKDYPYIIRKLCPYAEQILAIETPDNPRALPAEELAKAIRPYNANVRAEKNIPRAVEELFEMAGKDDVILSFWFTVFHRGDYPDRKYKKRGVKGIGTGRE